MESILPGHFTPSLQSNVHHFLTSLTCLAEKYERLCLSGENNHLPVSESEFRILDESLWATTQTLCREIEAVPQAFEEELASFRQCLFSTRVLKYFRRHKQTTRLWNKPAGYSGDYATIQWLCYGDQRWGCVGDVVANHVLRCTMAQQHRNKVLLQEEFITTHLTRTDGKPVTIVDIGCGPSIALHRLFTSLNRVSPAQITLIDLDPQALSFSESLLHPVQPETVRITYSQADVVQGLRRLSKQHNTQKVDAIMFGGLFDYLPDRIVTFVLSRAMGMLGNHGRIFFSQVSPSNPDQTFMDWWGDWRLIQRNESDLLRLCQEAGLSNDQVVFSRDSTGCAIVATVTK